MKRYGCLLIGIVFAWLGMPRDGNAEWMWTPESGKWISEKNIEKKSAMLLYEQAQGYEQAGNIAKAVHTYRRLVRQYPASSIAPDAQFWIGHMMEEQGEYYKAFREYQKVIENYPAYKKFNEILEREYQIGNLFLSGEKRKIMGLALLPAIDKAIEIFETIVRTAPYSPIAPRAQFNVGEAYRKINKFSDAIPEYQKVMENYPESDLVAEARYQIGQCGYQTTLKDSYDQTNTDIALDSMQTFVKKHQDSQKSVEMKQRINELVGRKAKKSFDIAEFYNRADAEEAAIIYYQDVIDNFPETQYAREASKKIDELIARPTKKKYADTLREASQAGRDKGFLGRLWPFGKVAPGTATPAAEQKGQIATSASLESAKKPGLLAGLWPFGKKEQAVGVMSAAAVSKKAPARPADGKKPFWAFWVKESKKSHLPLLREEVMTPSGAASQMKLPERGMSSREVLAQPSQATEEDVSVAPRAPLPDVSGEKPVEIATPAQSLPVPSVPSPESKDSPDLADRKISEGAASVLPSRPQPSPAVPSVLQVKSFQWEEEGSKVRLMFETTGDLQFKTFYLKDPSRILVSFSKGVFSKVMETIPVNKRGIQMIRQHFRSKETESGDGRPLNAIVVDLDRPKEANVYNDLDTFIIEMEKS